MMWQNLPPELSARDSDVGFAVRLMSKQVITGQHNCRYAIDLLHLICEVKSLDQFVSHSSIHNMEGVVLHQDRIRLYSDKNNRNRGVMS
jgi:hypothetical protein